VSNAIGLVTFAPVSYLALISRIISYDALVYAFPAFFVLMFIAPFLRRNVKLKDIGQFYYQFWGHIGRTIPIVFLLFMIALAVFFWLYPVFGIPKHRHEFGWLSDIILSLLFPIIALMGISEGRSAGKWGQTRLFCVLFDHLIKSDPISIDHLIESDPISNQV